MKNLMLSSVVLFGLVALSGHLTLAQEPSEPGIQGQGEVVLERKPELMRMHVDLLSKGKDLPDALAKLKTRRPKVEKQLESLGSVKDSWKFGEPEVDRTRDDQQQQMEQMIRQRMNQRMNQRRGKASKDKAVVAKPVTVSMKLTAEWPLKGEDASEVLVASHKLEEAIKAADLGGAKDAEEPTAEEAELAEEMENMASNYGGREGPKPGEPSFVFVAKISVADRQKALGEAFRLAKAEAAQLAQAAEIELGTLRNLRAGSGPALDEDYSEYQSFYNSGFGSALRRQTTGREHSTEALSPSPTSLKYKVTVHATFAVK